MANRDRDWEQNYAQNRPRGAGRDALPLDRSALDVPPVTPEPYMTGGRRFYYENQPTPAPDYLEERQDRQIDREPNMIRTRPDREYGQSARSDRSLANRMSARPLEQSHLQVKEIMTKRLATVERGASLSEAANLMKTEDVGSLPVIENKRIVGIVTDRDIVIRGLADANGMLTQTVGDVMSSELTFCRPEDQAVDVLRRMGDRRVRRMPVVDRSGVLHGIVSLGDLALEIEKADRLADALTDISKPGTWH
jgi:CBS domain-containing protein